MRKNLIKELKQLTPEEKLTVTEILWDSLKEEDVPISETQLNIIREREEEYKAGKSTLYTWDEVKSNKTAK
ncbi:addiction module protein [Gracilimonas mengyeensis]|uniref:Putative addiction module component, TIGR02574 family n=1 Tax=Gracilimonas mengyeensis TaxID=1302730 RepID=A0A521DCU5_9BACT|nr:addiction module protein [Gracilimonas mengyeensis]SMO69567.1 putative addiction module component, TIGR02574 family [Gracilimonas mengyeensis]